MSPKVASTMSLEVALAQITAQIVQTQNALMLKLAAMLVMLCHNNTHQITSRYQQVINSLVTTDTKDNGVIHTEDVEKIDKIEVEDMEYFPRQRRIQIYLR